MKKSIWIQSGDAYRIKSGVVYIGAHYMAEAAELGHKYVQNRAKALLSGMEDEFFFKKNKDSKDPILFMSRKAAEMVMETWRNSRAVISGREKIREVFDKGEQEHQRNLARGDVRHQKIERPDQAEQSAPPFKRRYGLVDIAKPEAAPEAAGSPPELNWASLIRAMNLPVPALDLAAHCKLLHLDERSCLLELSNSGTFSEHAEVLFEKAIQAFFNRPIKLTVKRPMETAQDAPALDPALPAITPQDWNGEPVQTVDARELHAWLEVGTKFADWIKERIDDYGFLEGRDFLSFSENREKPKGGRPATEYHITTDMAKELSMVERNEKGKEARAYFIKCEKRLKAEVLGKPAAESGNARRALSVRDIVAELEAAAQFNLSYIGMPKEQAVIGANFAVKNKHGIDYLALVNAGEMPATTQDVLVNPTFIGLRFGLSAEAVNNLLCRLGLQIRFHDEKGKAQYRLTERGLAFGEYVVECVRGKVEPIRRVKWRPNVIDFVMSQTSALDSDGEAAA